MIKIPYNLLFTNLVPTHGYSEKEERVDDSHVEPPASITVGASGI